MLLSILGGFGATEIIPTNNDNCSPQTISHREQKFEISNQTNVMGFFIKNVNSFVLKLLKKDGNPCHKIKKSLCL